MATSLFSGSDLFSAVVISPSVRVSIADAIINDGEQLDGAGDFFNDGGSHGGFHGLLRRIPWVEDRAILEFDLSSFSNTLLTSATIDFTISANNFSGSQYREFDLYLYVGNGIADISDFSISGTYISSIGYSVDDREQHFRLDVFNATQAILNNGAGFLGIRFNPIGDDNSPSLVEPNVSLTLVPEPSTYSLLLIAGAGALWLLRRRRDCNGSRKP